MNEDDKVDIVVTNSHNHSIMIYFNSGNGKFAEEKIYPYNFEPHSIQLADMNGDGKVDIIASSQFSKEIVIFYNTGNEIFVDKTVITMDYEPTSVAVADVNTNDKLDIIVTAPGRNRFDIIFNPGYGTFITQIMYAARFESELVKVIDLNNDNNPDIIVVGYKSITVWFNNGTGKFINRTAYSIPGDGAVFYIALVDMVFRIHSDQFGIMFNEGKGTFSAPTIYAMNFTIDSLEVVDVNYDKNPDIIFVDTDDNTINIYFNTGNGTFPNRKIYAIDRRPSNAVSADDYATAADIDGDGKMEVIIIRETIVGILSTVCS